MTGRPWIQPCDLATAKKKTREPPFPPPLPGELHWFDLVACDRVKPFALPHYAIGCSKSRKVAYRVYFRNAGSSSRESGRLRVRGCPFLGPLGGARLVRLSSGGVAWRIPFVSVAVNHRQTGIPRV